MTAPSSTLPSRHILLISAGAQHIGVTERILRETGDKVTVCTVNEVVDKLTYDPSIDAIIYAGGLCPIEDGPPLPEELFWIDIGRSYQEIIKHSVAVPVLISGHGARLTASEDRSVRIITSKKPLAQSSTRTTHFNVITRGNGRFRSKRATARRITLFDGLDQIPITVFAGQGMVAAPSEYCITGKTSCGFTAVCEFWEAGIFLCDFDITLLAEEHQRICLRNFLSAQDRLAEQEAQRDDNKHEAHEPDLLGLEGLLMFS